MEITKNYSKKKKISTPILLLIYLEIILNGYNYSKVEEDKNQQTNWSPSLLTKIIFKAINKLV